MPIEPDDLSSRPLKPADRRFLWGFLLVVVGLFVAELVRDFTPVKSAVVFFILAWAPLVAIHELGHAAVARLFGWHLPVIAIGVGSVVKQWRWGATRVELRAIPLGGFVKAVPRSRRLARVASFLLYAGGPGAELAVVGLVGAWIGFDVLTTLSSDYGTIALQAVCAAAMVGAVTNLLPMTLASGQWTDGKGMLMSFFLQPEDLDRSMAVPVLEEGRQLLAAGEAARALEVFEAALPRFPDLVDLHYARAVALVALGRRLEALMDLRALALDPRRSEKLRAQAEVVLQQLRELQRPTL